MFRTRIYYTLRSCDPFLVPINCDRVVSSDYPIRSARSARPYLISALEAEYGELAPETLSQIDIRAYEHIPS